MNLEKYNYAAYRAAVWREAAALLRGRFFPENGSTPTPIESTTVFRVAKEVPQEVIQDVVLALDRAAMDDERTTQQFGLAEKTDDEIKHLTEIAKVTAATKTPRSVKEALKRRGVRKAKP